jgi:hypothetical protein
VPRDPRQGLCGVSRDVRHGVEVCEESRNSEDNVRAHCVTTMTAADTRLDTLIEDSDSICLTLRYYKSDAFPLRYL